jgi:hypothetical protein
MPPRRKVVTKAAKATVSVGAPKPASKGSKAAALSTGSKGAPSSKDQFSNDSSSETESDSDSEKKKKTVNLKLLKAKEGGGFAELLTNE